MLKNILFTLTFLFFFSFQLNAKSRWAPPVRESPITGFSDPETVAISTFAWVKIPTSDLSSRMGYVVSVPSTLNANIAAHFGDCFSTLVSTTVRPMEFLKGNGFTLVPADEDVCLWALSLHTTTESIHVQQVNQ